MDFEDIQLIILPKSGIASIITSEFRVRLIVALFELKKTAGAQIGLTPDALPADADDFRNSAICSVARSVQMSGSQGGAIQNLQQQDVNELLFKNGKGKINYPQVVGSFEAGPVVGFDSGIPNDVDHSGRFLLLLHQVANFGDNASPQTGDAFA